MLRMCTDRGLMSRGVGKEEGRAAILCWVLLLPGQPLLRISSTGGGLYNMRETAYMGCEATMLTPPCSADLVWSKLA